MITENDELLFSRNRLAKDIVGEIVMAEKPDGIIRKWRNIFQIPQNKLAASLGVTSSVVSDYESGRRKSPGIQVIKKYVNCLLDIDMREGGNVIKSFAKQKKQITPYKAIIDIKEFEDGVMVSDFCKTIGAHTLTKDGLNDRVIYGYTVIDSEKAIVEFSFQELLNLYGMTTQRALIFTKVTTGRTPLVAIKLTNLHPGLVVLHGLSVVDDIAKRIAQVENIPLALCRLERVDDIIEQLKTSPY